MWSPCSVVSAMWQLVNKMGSKGFVQVISRALPIDVQAHAVALAKRRDVGPPATAWRSHWQMVLSAVLWPDKYKVHGCEYALAVYSCERKTRLLYGKVWKWGHVPDKLLRVWSSCEYLDELRCRRGKAKIEKFLQRHQYFP